MQASQGALQNKKNNNNKEANGLAIQLKKKQTQTGMFLKLI